ncbi:putative membrane protein [Aquimarina sp. EL_43]|uniref:CCC motif membrane protein n=1 Tax=Aquimarina TaxID=290174 RepID=UPI00047286E3|nr:MULTISPECIES: CCC motif membrane protein [Aquimarina]MBG6132690.1 putative membrane protein [Aquimarina sp. EL_35]MBG6152820.1 putative membrane protein [Aquimarina sp. EL_32]MBG6170827.1 putative membrane protein [Aquimarina sp. EL_43]
MENKQQLPNATLVLIFGIASIVTCFCYGFLGLVFGIIALVLAKKAKELYLANPELYTGYENLNAGRICAIIGTILSSLYLLIIIGYIIFMGALMPWSEILNQ